jgi:hypothetical protein
MSLATLMAALAGSAGHHCQKFVDGCLSSGWQSMLELSLGCADVAKGKSLVGLMGEQQASG